MKLRVILTTIGSEEAARELARTLVSERLAACVNIIPGATSVYRWEGKIAEEGEVLLFIKTTEKEEPNLKTRLHEIHPYSIPEYVEIALAGVSEKYLAWAVGEVGSEKE